MVSITLVIGVVFLILAGIWTVRSKEWLQTAFVLVAAFFLAVTKPEVPTTVRDALLSVAQFIVNIFS